MPIDKYLYIRKAAEVEEIIYRSQVISDINAAFSGPENKLKNLQKLYTEIMGFEIHWEGDPDWEEKLKAYQR